MRLIPQSSHELLIPDHDFAFTTISDVEGPLDEALMAVGAGEVVGGGIGSGWYRIEMEIERLDDALSVLGRVARELDLPASTLFRPTGAAHAQPLATAVDAGNSAGEPQESGGAPVARDLSLDS